MSWQEGPNGQPLQPARRLRSPVAASWRNGKSARRKPPDYRLALSLPLHTGRGPTIATVANATLYSPVIGEDFFRVCRDTERTPHLTRIAGYFIGRGMDQATATEFCLSWNARNDPPMDRSKVSDTVASLFRTHARNHPIDHDPGTPLFDMAAARVDRFLDADPPARRWVLTDCLPLGKVGLLVAPGGTGKSQLALQLAIAVATGTGLADWWTVGERGPVLALFAEEDEEELHRRLRAILRTTGPGRCGRSPWSGASGCSTPGGRRTDVIGPDRQ